jgi:multidrug efflux pump subunit AcrA (membrane-fusion protein)
MNKRIRKKIEKRRLAELRAQELGIDYENMNDDEIFAVIAEEEHNRELIESSNNDSLVEDKSIDEEAEAEAIALAEEAEANRIVEEEIAKAEQEAESLAKEKKAREEEEAYRLAEEEKARLKAEEERLAEEERAKAEEEANRLAEEEKAMAEAEEEANRLAEEEKAIAEAEEEAKAKSEAEKSKLVSLVSTLEDVKISDKEIDSKIDETVADSEVSSDEVSIDSHEKEFVDVESEENKKEAQRLDYLDREKVRSDLQTKLIIESLDELSSYDDEYIKNQLAEEAEKKEVQRLEYIQREDIRFETQNKYIEEALNSKSNENVVKSPKIVVSKDVLKTVLSSKKPILVRRNALNGAIESAKSNDETKKVEKNHSEVSSQSSNIDVEKIVKSAIKEAVVELNKDKNLNQSSNNNNSGIKVVTENGTKYIMVNGVKVDKIENFTEALGIKREEKEIEPTVASIDTDDNLGETKLEETETSIRKELRKKNSKKKRKTIITWIIILILLGGATYLYNFYNTNRRMPWTSAESIAKDVPTYTEVKITEEETAPIVDINGVLEAYDLQNVVLRTSGAIKTINVKEGDVVKKGDILVTVDDSAEQYNIANIESQIKSAKLTGNANTLKLLELQLENAKNSLEYTKAIANFDGVVAQQGWTVGDYNSLTTTTNNSMIIADLSKFKATVQIDELDIGYVSVGQKAELTFDSLPGVIVEAEVSSIPMLGRYSTQGFGVLDVEITIPNPPKRLKTGFTFSGKIVADNKESITVVNQAAVYPNGSKQYVKQRMADGSLKEIEVTVRYLGENKVQILSGDIYVGDTVVIENKKSLEDSLRVRL